MSAALARPSAMRRVLTWLAVLLAMAAFGGMVTRGVGLAREAARFTHCRTNLKQIELALHNYHDTHGCFPPAVIYGPDGKPWHSWRVLIRPFLEASPFYSRYRFDEPWDGPNNRRLREEYDGYTERFGSVLHCPSDESDGTHTSYLAVIGEGTMWPQDGTATLADAADGTESVIQVVEVSGSGVHWMEPKDLRLDAMSFRLNSADDAIRSGHVGAGWLRDGPLRANVAFTDGSVRPLDADTRPETIRSLLLRDDGRSGEVP